MIYISAQPDTNYFMWQLKILLQNFSSLGIAREQIHILIGYNAYSGLSEPFKEFINDHLHLGTFFTYPDLRQRKEYLSSIRPNILAQHFRENTYLEKEVIFYHDSDIIFSRIPQINCLDKDENLYVSDTRSYLDRNYILSLTSQDFLEKMLAIVGISMENVLKNDKNTGGAQYVLKGITAVFWDKVERDSEDLYTLICGFNKDYWLKECGLGTVKKSNIAQIQPWYSDMWAVLWNLWLENRTVLIHDELNFCWPYDPISCWRKNSILHYSGKITDRTSFFKKGEYEHYPPWYDDSLLSIPNSNCSYKVVELILNIRKNLDLNRPLLNSHIVLYTPHYDENKLRIYKLNKNYIQKYLNISVELYCLTTKKNYMYLQNRLNVSSFSFSTAKKDTTIFIPLNLLLDISDIQSLCEFGKKKPEIICYQVKNITMVDLLFQEVFGKILDMSLLCKNKGKMNTIYSKDAKINNIVSIPTGKLINFNRSLINSKRTTLVINHAYYAI